jgi:hypothetical protein
MPRRADDAATLEFVARLIGRLIARDGLDFTAAVAKVAADAPPALQGSVASLQAVAAGQRLPRGRSTAALGSILQVVRDSAGKIDQAVVAFVINATVGHDSVTDVVRALRSSVAYALTLLAVLSVVGATIEVFVLPNLATLYGGYGDQLPALTRMLLTRSSPLLLVVLVGLLFGFAAVWCSWQLGRAARQSLPMPGVFRTLPLVRAVASDLDALIYLVYTSTLLAGGLPPEAARAKAQTLLDPVSHRPLPTPLAAYLEVAQRLGLLPDEVQSQIKLQAKTLAASADRFGHTIDIVLRLAVYLAIAGFVIAMYLPIFTLGSVV